MMGHATTRREFLAGSGDLVVGFAFAGPMATAPADTGRPEKTVALDEVEPRTLESHLRPGLHFVGEVLDLDGLIGGYNFQAAWSTGWLGGESV